jgi:threonine/homoserine/homoserine lactone efflux protein
MRPSREGSEGSLARQVSILAFSSFAIEFLALSIYSTICYRAGRRAAPRFRPVIERLGGGLLIGAAVGLATLRPGLLC